MANSRDTKILLLVCLLAVSLRVWGLRNQSLSMDEVTEIHIASLSLKQIVLYPDGFPPLFHLLLKGWMLFFPSAELTRGLSVLFGCLSIPVIWKLGNLLSEGKAGIWAALILAISPFHIWYSQETRAYALFYLEALMVLYFFFKAMAKDSYRDWIFYAAFCLAGLYTHYYFSLLVISCLMLAIFERRSWIGLKKIMLIHAGMLLFIPPLLFMLVQGDLRTQETYPGKTYFNVKSLVYTYFSYFSGYTLGPSKRDLHSLSNEVAMKQLLPWVISLGSCVLYFLTYSLSKHYAPSVKKSLYFLAIFPVLLCGFLAEAMDVGYQVRYTMWATIPLYLLTANGIFISWQQRLGRFFLFFICALFAMSLYNRHFVDSYGTEDTRGLASYILLHSQKSTPVFVSGPIFRSIGHYLGKDVPVYRLATVGKRGEGLQEAFATLQNTQKGDTTFWFVYSRAFHGDPEGRLKEALLRDNIIKKKADFVGIELFLGMLPSS